MKYISTRGKSEAVSFSEAVALGLAPDGGLYLPEALPDLTEAFKAMENAAQQADLMVGSIEKSQEKQQEVLKGLQGRFYKENANAAKTIKENFQRSANSQEKLRKLSRELLLAETAAKRKAIREQMELTKKAQEAARTAQGFVEIGFWLPRAAQQFPKKAQEAYGPREAGSSLGARGDKSRETKARRYKRRQDKRRDTTSTTLRQLRLQASTTRGPGGMCEAPK